MKANELPINPFLAEPMYLKGYIERMGTGTADILRIAAENNLFLLKMRISQPYSTDQVPTKYPTSTPQVPTKFGRCSEFIESA